MSAAFPWPIPIYDSLQALDIDAERQATNSHTGMATTMKVLTAEILFKGMMC